MDRRDGSLRLVLQFLRAQESGDPYAFRFEPQDYILPTAGGDSPSARFDWTPELLSDLQAVRLPGRDPEVVQRVGEKLRAFVKDAGWAHYEQQILQALAEHRPVSLTLRSSAAELYALPWELLTLKTGQCIGELDGLLIRSEWPESPSVAEQPSPRPEGGRILVAWSAAGGVVPAAEHLRAIHTACAAGFLPFNTGHTGSESAPATDVLANASLGRIVQALQAAQRTGAPIAVLHLLCHGAALGSTFGLCLDGEVGPVVVDAAQLRQHLAPFAAMVRLVVLSACDSGNLGALGSRLGGVAQALHRCGFQSVIASRYPLSVLGSNTLTETLYRELLAGPSSLESALLSARRRMAQDEAGLPAAQRRLDWASVQLYARHEDGDDTRPIVIRPYRGLLAFQPEHRRFFFGRDREAGEILADLQSLIDQRDPHGQRRPRFLIVAGASGTGKSSLVLAGAVPRILDADPRLVLLRMRPGRDPGSVLDETLTRRPPGAPALLVVDQLEELFTHTEAPADREAFVRRLWSLATSAEVDVRVLITLRVDFIGRCGDLAVNAAGLRLDRIAYDEPYRVFVAQLQPEQLRASIVEPARRVGLALQDGLADRMLQEVGSEPGALPLLQDALDVLWQHREGRTLTQAAYDALGGVIGALQIRADGIVNKLEREDLGIAKRLLVSLVAVADDTSMDTRLRVPLAELVRGFSATEAAGFERVLRELVTARLLVQDGDGQTSRVEVAHEALIRKWRALRTWVDEDRAWLLVQRRVQQAALQWEAQGREESLLYRGGQLAQASEWRAAWEPRLGALERQFLDASEAQRARIKAEEGQRLIRERDRARQNRTAAIVLGALFVIAAAAGLQVYQKTVEIRDALLTSTAASHPEDPTMAAALLRESAELRSPRWTQAAVAVLQRRIARSVLRGHTGGIRGAAFSPDGKKVVTAAQDQTARIWSADGSGAATVLRGHEGRLTAVAWSHDGSRIVTSSADRTARIWSVESASVLLVLRGHDAEVTAIALSSDGKKIVTGSADRTARIWSAEGAGEPLVLRGHTGTITAVALSPAGDRIATGSADGTARIWSSDGAERAVLGGHEAEVTAVAFAPDGKRLVTGSLDQRARIWDLSGSGAPLIVLEQRSPIYAVAFGPDGKTLAIGAHDRSARLWRVDGTGPPIEVGGFGGHALAVRSVALSSDGSQLLTGSDDQTARVFGTTDPGAGARIVLGETRSPIAAVALSPDGKRLVVGTADPAARIWSADGAGTPLVLSGHTAALTAVAFSPDGKRLVTGAQDQTARVWSADGSGTPLVLSGHTAALTAVAFSPDGKRLVTGAQDQSARVWSVDGSGAPLVLGGHTAALTAVVFSPDGKRLATGARDKRVRIWSAESAGAPILIEQLAVDVTSLAFSRDGKKLLIGAADANAYLWEPAGEVAPLRLQGHRGEITAVALSPDGETIATGSTDQTVRLWRADGAGPSIELRGHQGSVTSVTFTPDGEQLVTGAADQTVRRWSVAGTALISALWDATSECVPVALRRELLLEFRGEARDCHSRCLSEVARRRGLAAH